MNKIKFIMINILVNFIDVSINIIVGLAILAIMLAFLAVLIWMGELLSNTELFFLGVVLGVSSYFLGRIFRRGRN